MYGGRGAEVVYKRAKHFGKRPRVLVATVIGTFACFCLFVSQYSASKDESQVWVWFGMRSDGRCGRDFVVEGYGEPVCATGLCCSSHGWCGAGEEYCSVALGCQSGCIDSNGSPVHGGADAPPDAEPPLEDDDYYYRSKYHRYDEDDEYRRYRGSGHHGYHDEDYHHRYDEDDSRWDGAEDLYGGDEALHGDHRDAMGNIHHADEPYGDGAHYGGEHPEHEHYGAHEHDGHGHAYGADHSNHDTH